MDSSKTTLQLSTTKPKLLDVNKIWVYSYINDIYRDDLSNHYGEYSPSYLSSQTEKEAYITIFNDSHISIQWYFIVAHMLIENDAMKTYLLEKAIVSEEDRLKYPYDYKDYDKIMEVLSGKHSPVLEVVDDTIKSIKWTSKSEEEEWFYVMHRFSPQEWLPISDYGIELYNDMKKYIPKSTLDDMIYEFMKVAIQVNHVYLSTVITLSGYKMSMSVFLRAGNMHFSLTIDNMGDRFE